MKNESDVCGAEGCQKVFVVGSEVMVEDKNFLLVGLSRAPIRLRRFVFPAPDGPYIDMNSPASTIRSMFFSASTTTSSISNCLHNAEATTTFSVNVCRPLWISNDGNPICFAVPSF